MMKTKKQLATVFIFLGALVGVVIGNFVFDSTDSPTQPVPMTNIQIAEICRPNPDLWECRVYLASIIDGFGGNDEFTEIYRGKE